MGTATKDAETRTKTRYVVLEKHSEPTVPGAINWQSVGTYEGLSDIEAIKAAASSPDLEPGDGTFVAVPARSFRERTIQTQTVTRVSIS